MPRSRSNSTIQTPANVPLTAREVNRIVRRQLHQAIEPKHFDTINSGTAGIAGSGILYLSAMAQGLTDITRLGDQIDIDAVDLRWDMVFADATNFMRLIVFQWTGDAVTDVPTVPDILESVPYYLSPYNWDLKGKYRILLDKSVFLENAASARGSIGHATVIPPFKHQQFLAASTNIEAGGIFALFVSDSAAAPNPAYDLYTRIEYRDA